jgi:hypothetical protein
MNLNKYPPKIVYELLDKAVPVKTDDDPKILRSRIIEKMNAFEKYVVKTFGYESTPFQWSDTLSKFAKAINPHINTYNKMCVDNELADSHLANATSFVPGDLASSMYRGYDDNYFFRKSLYYTYSSIWRRDAVRAVNHLTMPADIIAILGNFDRHKFATITDKLAHDGDTPLINALANCGITPDVFICFLLQYYLSGAFLKINLI